MINDRRQQHIHLLEPLFRKWEWWFIYPTVLLPPQRHMISYVCGVVISIFIACGQATNDDAREGVVCVYFPATTLPSTHFSPFPAILLNNHRATAPRVWKVWYSVTRATTHTRTPAHDTQREASGNNNMTRIMIVMKKVTKAWRRMSLSLLWAACVLTCNGVWNVLYNVACKHQMWLWYVENMYVKRNKRQHCFPIPCAFVPMCLWWKQCSGGGWWYIMINEIMWTVFAMLYIYIVLWHTTHLPTVVMAAVTSMWRRRLYLVTFPHW